MINARDDYDKVFDIEMDAYINGLKNYPGEIFPEIVFRFVRELEVSFIKAINQHHVFDLIKLATDISVAAKYLVHEKDIAFCILSVLPPPDRFDEDSQFILAQIVDQVEQEYGGAIERLEKKWRWEIRHRETVGETGESH